MPYHISLFSNNNYCQNFTCLLYTVTAETNIPMDMMFNGVSLKYRLFYFLMKCFDPFEISELLELSIN